MTLSHLKFTPHQQDLQIRNLYYTMLLCQSKNPNQTVTESEMSRIICLFRIVDNDNVNFHEYG